MDTKTNKLKFKWKVWAAPIAAVIAAVIVGCFSLFSNSQAAKNDQVQSVKDQKVDSGNINNYNAHGNINIYSKDTTVNPPPKLENKEKKQKNSNTKQKPTISAGDNNIIIEGDNNTVNKYGLEISKPKISDIKETDCPGKYKSSSYPDVAPDALSIEDSLFKSIITFKYSYQLRAGQMIIGFNNSNQIRYINFHYTDPEGHLYGDENFIDANGNHGIKIFDPITGNIQIEIYSAIKYLNIKDRLVLFVDSFTLK